MPKKLKIFARDFYLFVSGIILSFLLQLIYDSMREEPFYQNIMPISHWRFVLALVCLIVFILIFYYSEKNTV